MPFKNEAYYIYRMLIRMALISINYLILLMPGSAIKS